MDAAALRPIVLVVDDDDDHTLMLEMSLRALGFDVCTAGSVREARSTLATCRVDALVTDFWLGDGTATDLLAAVGERRPRAAVLLTGFDGSAPELARAFDAYLVKPTSAEQIASTLRELLRRPRSGTLAKVVPTSPRDAGRGAA